ncbi:MAG: tyrosine-type recombinase/integrase [Bryobacterales bacterium]|nr:tyrosine-type recombinase/integrase [Bryobacterales bacterium]
MKLSEACDAYLRDIKARNFRYSTQKNYKYLFRSWLSYAEKHDLTQLSSFDLVEMRTWRESWDCKPGTQVRQLQQLRAFFSHAVRSGWIDASPMSALKFPRSQSKPRMPLSIDEFRALIAASATKPKEQALLFLMRFSGLSICDAVTLRRDAIRGNDLTLRRAKSGELVMLYIPDMVTTALNRIKKPGHEYFFWSGSSMASSAANYWRTRLNLIAHKAGVEYFNPHRLRHTFAAEFLLAGKSMEDLSTLLGHSSVNTTERHYAQWNLARRNRLVRITRDIYECNPSLLVFDGCIPRKNNTGAVAAAPVNSSASKPMQSSSIIY